MSNFNVGDTVYIGRYKTILKTRLGTDTLGGWIVEPPVCETKYWNEDEMTLVRYEDYN